MKHLAEYSNEEFVRNDETFYSFSAAYVAQAFAAALALGVRDLLVSPPELQEFCRAYDQILPWDWDGTRFRGIRLHLTNDKD